MTMQAIAERPDPGLRALNGPVTPVLMGEHHLRGAYALLSRDLSQLYPNGREWLDRKLFEVGEGRASGLVVEGHEGEILGALLETPKGKGRVKLSTIFVARRYRRRGVGTALMRSLNVNWQIRDVEHALVTVAASRVGEIYPFLRDWGFSLATIARERYGPGRDEFVFSWQSQD